MLQFAGGTVLRIAKDLAENNQFEAKVGLKPEKLRATRHVLREYGNMSSACVLFILDEIRKTSAEEKNCTTGEGLELGGALRVRAGAYCGDSSSTQYCNLNSTNQRCISAYGWLPSSY